MKKLLILPFLLCYCIAFTQNFQWAKQIGAQGQEVNSSIEVDNLGNVYIAGYFNNIIDADPGPGVFELTSSGKRDVFIVKLDVSGKFIWAKNMGGTGDDFGISLAVDKSGNVIVTGTFYFTANFDIGNTNTELTSLGVYDIFIVKLNSAGQFLWVKQFGSTYSDDALSIIVDKDENIYSTGLFKRVIDFDPGIGVKEIDILNSEDGTFILKLNSLGEFIWVKGLVGGGTNSCTSISVDESGNIYSTGNFSTQLDFDEEGTGYILTSEGQSDLFVMKLLPDGKFSWVNQMGDYYGGAAGKSICTDKDGSTYILGTFSDSLDFDNGPGLSKLVSKGYVDNFILKLDKNGVFEWVKQYGNEKYDNGSKIVIDKMSDIYATGFFNGTVDFDPNSSSHILSSIAKTDLYILKLNSAGEFIWTYSVGGKDSEGVTSITLDDLSNIYISGYFQNKVDFDPGPEVFELSAEFSTDVFVNRIDQNLTSIDKEEENSSLTLYYPNPAYNDLTIELNEKLKTSENIQITILDNVGKECYNNNISNGVKSFNIDLGHIMNGMYIIQIKEEGNLLETHKLIVMK